MAKARRLRFVTRGEEKIERLPWGRHDWLSRPDIVRARGLLLVRVHMPRGKAHGFHRQPAMEEIIYVLAGRAEVWVDREKKLLRSGEIAYIPRGTVHAIFNAGRGVLRFLSVFAPARARAPALVDVSAEEPWASLRGRPAR
jgi:quercetin dioxygenase-like cupin family protein